MPSLGTPHSLKGSFAYSSGLVVTGVPPSTGVLFREHRVSDLFKNQ